ncbi:hypothetical protein SAMN04489726_3167 [Allokutzneria albata]|uniref:Major Facilitator Superfamily protein n=1 Tax=Allokutzneria albata TaxID=211114 RepID=A0A1G9VPU6_ALLAB|nr:MFS transporter [Allokutzneria albata]SDM74244.1 hypothetical protein SAMN04489726_3167 [Allokutzneria albata]
MSLQQFVADLVHSGPASPAVEFVTSLGRTVAGIFVYFWIASVMPGTPATSLAIVMACFGIGAALGPFLAPLARRFLDARASVLLALYSALALVVVFGCSVLVLPSWPIALCYVVAMRMVMRTRDVLLTTLRQESFRGSRFTTIMSWSFALSSFGALVGSWHGVAFHVPQYPVFGLAMLALALVFTIVVVTSRK